MASNGTTCRRRTPDHPPYALMIGTAIKSLAEEGGSTEESISRFIRSHYTDIPPGHDLLLPYYLDRLTARAEFLVSAPGRYLVPPHLQEEDPQPPPPPPPQPEEEEKKKNVGPTEEPKEGEDSVSIEEGLPLVCKGDLVMELQALASSPGPKPAEVPIRKRGRPSTKKKVSPETMGLPESGGCGLLVSTFASESVAPKCNNLEPNNEGDEPDNRLRKRGRPPKKNGMSCLAKSGGCGLSVSTFASDSLALEWNSLEPNNVGDKPDNIPRKRGMPLKKKKKKKDMSLETIVPWERSVSSLPSVPVAQKLDNVEHKKELNKSNTVPKRLGRPPKSKPMLAAEETLMIKCEPESVWATAEKSSSKGRGRPPNSGEKADTGEPESTGATMEKKMGKRLGRPPKNSGKKKDKGEPESAGTTVENSTAKHHGIPPNSGEKADNGEPESTGATTEKKTGKHLGRPLKNSGKKKDKGEPESTGTTVEKSTAKHRGRPPKTKTDNGELVLVTSKRLGRPPKNSGKKTMEEKTGKPHGRPQKQKPDAVGFLI